MFFLSEAQASPIVLQDPPKSKLKRQLSINTVEQSEFLRSFKRPATSDRPHMPSRRHLPDTSDDDVTDDDKGDVGYTSEGSDDDDDKSRLKSLGYRSKFKGLQRAGDEVDGSSISGSCASASISSFADRSRTLQEQGISQSPGSLQRIPTIYCPTSDDQPENIYEDAPLASPNRFDLADIGLTSPFLGRTSGGHGPQDDVFVFPDSAAPRKLSPYKTSPSKTETRFEDPDRELSIRKRISGERDLFEREERFPHQIKERKRTHKWLHDDRNLLPEREASQYPEHVCPKKGFLFPKTANITDPPHFSPRVVLADSKPRFPVATATLSQSKYEENIERLHILQKEVQRAKRVFGTPPKSWDYDSRQKSPTSAKVRDLIKRNTKRSISDIDRSPNEKEIRENAEDVRNTYYRSVSDPRASPNQLRSVIQRPSPLLRDSTRSTRTDEIRAESIVSDVIKNLFYTLL